MAPPSVGNILPQLAQSQSGPPIAGHGGNPTEAQASPFHGWENYPLTLPNYRTLSHNGSVISKNLHDDSQRLFHGPKAASLEILDVLETPDANLPLIQRNADHDSFEEILTDDRIFHFRCFTITPKHSWDKLPITEEMLRKLLTFYNVSPDFLRVVHNFGRQVRERIPSSAVFRRLLKPKGTYPTAYVSEICIRMAQVEKHGRVDPDDPTLDPWSVRQIGCYQRFDYQNDSSVCIHIMPPKDVKSRLAESLAGGRFSKQSEHLSPLSLHLAFVTTAMQNWPAYVEDLESELVKHQTCVLLTDEEWEDCRRGVGGGARVRYSDLRVLQRYLRERVLNTISILNFNMDVLQGLQAHAEELLSLRLLSDASYKDASDILEYNISILRNLQRDTETVLDKAGNTAQLIQVMIEIRNDGLIRSYTRANNKLVDVARDNHEDSKRMIELARLAKRDSRTMRVATMLATIYLPGTFVATVFGMDFFHSDIDRAGGKRVDRFSVERHVWIFAVILVGFTALTFVSFLLWKWSLRRQDQELGPWDGDEEQGLWRETGAGDKAPVVRRDPMKIG